MPDETFRGLEELWLHLIATEGWDLSLSSVELTDVSNGDAEHEGSQWEPPHGWFPYYKPDD